MGACEWQFFPGRLKCIHCERVIHTRTRLVHSQCPINPAADRPVWVQAGAILPGPGTQIKKLLAGWPLYIESTENCPCNRHAAQMDAWGADECERRMDEIVGWLRDESASRGLPFLDVAGRVLVRRAIAKARQRDRPPTKFAGPA